MKVQHHLARASLIGLAVALSACSVIQEDKIDYKSAQKASTLEVPPDLTQLAKDTRYTTAADTSVSALALQAGQGSGVWNTNSRRGLKHTRAHEARAA